MLNPYDDLELTVTGDVETVANWIDEHIVAGKASLDGLGEYRQGEATAEILEALKTRDTLNLDYGLLSIVRL